MLQPGVDPNLPPMSNDRHFLMDRYSQHTVHCSACRGALRNIRALKAISAAVSLVAATAIWSRPANLAKILVGSIASVFFSYYMSRLERKMMFTDYVHAHK